MTAKDIVKFWRDGADDAFKTAQKLIEAKRFHHALFFCHLALEKILKAVCVAKTGKVAPPVHSLLLLVEKADIKINQDKRDQLREINTFNIEARYDDYKLKFYQKATEKFANEWFTKTKELLVWLKKN